jgi:pyruvate/2-oxoglutarate dehydrogenase complex dihydrolipoamide dehydrogenase (E3) component
MVKTATNVRQMTQNLAKFDVEEVSGSDFAVKCGLRVIQDEVSKIIPSRKEVVTKSGRVFSYKKLCLCHGARPNLIDSANPHVLGIRDTESVVHFQERLQGSDRIVVLGNGGIASEIVHELKNVDIVWVIKDDSITSTFVDAGAAEFFVQAMGDSNWSTDEPSVTKRLKYTNETAKTSKDIHVLGSALGPDWHTGFVKSGMAKRNKRIDIQYQCEVKRVLRRQEFDESELTETRVFNHDTESKARNIYVELTNGKVIGCDFLISATGVIPNSDTIQIEGDESLDLADDGGIVVNENMETSIPDIFAAGDVCHAAFQTSKHWFQMRLWTQV